MLDVVSDAVRGRTGSGLTLVVGIAGPVAVGKSTIARRLADELGAAVISTDSFLRTNADLGAHDLGVRKGFPETYDHNEVAAVMRAVRTGARSRVRVYSHDVYDIVEGVTRDVAPGGVVIVEGIIALQQPIVASLDVGVYVDAPEPAIRGWFVERFIRLVEGARKDPASFYHSFRDLDDPQVTSIAEATWDGINAVNLHQHIAPSRANADFVIEKNADHSIRAVTKR